MVGLRPAVRFALAVTLTLAYVALAFFFSQPWRDDLRVELSVLTSWAIPFMLATHPRSYSISVEMAIPLSRISSGMEERSSSSTADARTALLGALFSRASAPA